MPEFNWRLPALATVLVAVACLTSWMVDHLGYCLAIIGFFAAFAVVGWLMDVDCKRYMDSNRRNREYHP